MCQLKQGFSDGSVSLDEKTGILRVDKNEIGLVYYRQCYQEEDFQQPNGEWDEDIWSVRQNLENSMAIKCPSIDGQLATFKKF